MAPASDRIDDVIAGRYEIRAVVGRGGQGIVYRALDRWTEHMVAVKVLGSKAARDPQMAQRMVREQQALSALKGTSAVELLDVRVVVAFGQHAGDHPPLFRDPEAAVGTQLLDVDGLLQGCSNESAPKV